MKHLLGIWLFVWTFGSIAQDYAIAKIPEQLTDGVNAVYRKDVGHFKILALDKAEYTYTLAVTLLNERAEDEAFITVGYDNLRSVANLEIRLYDSKGKQIRKVKNGEIHDRAANSGSFMEDSRFKWVEVAHNQYPYTIEYTYTIKYKYLYSIPNWFFQQVDDISVENSSFTLEYPEDVGARYLELNFEGDKSETSEKGIKRLTWTISNLPPFDKEPYGPSLSDIMPNIRTAVAKFSYEGYEGDLSTWDGMAKWQLALNEGREDLPEEVVQELTALTEGLSRIEKIKTVYEYMQARTRYVSIQLGIGGFQPFPAKFVHETGYGDCKALSFYTQSLLRAIDIDSYYTWVYGGYNPPRVNYDFPEDLFNHIILAVPNEQDTVWLECTNQTNPFGYLGDFTGNREVLLINENGGHIVSTTKYPKQQNTSSSKTQVAIGPSGNAEVHQNTTTRGTLSGLPLGLMTIPFEDQKEYLEKNIDIATFELIDFDLSLKNEVDEVSLSAHLFVNRLMSKSGNRLFLQPNIMNKNTFVPKRNRDRQYDIIVHSGYIETDTIDFTIPDGFRLEAGFDPIDIESDFGLYHAEILVDDEGQIKYVRRFEQNNGTFPKEQYDNFLDFHKQVVRSDQRKIALISGT